MLLRLAELPNLIPLVKPFTNKVVVPSAPPIAKLVPVATPIFGVVSVGEACITNTLPVPVCAATDVALPADVIGPVRLALVALLPFSF